MCVWTFVGACDAINLFVIHTQIVSKVAYSRIPYGLAVVAWCDVHVPNAHRAQYISLQYLNTSNSPIPICHGRILEYP